MILRGKDILERELRDIWYKVENPKSYYAQMGGGHSFEDFLRAHKNADCLALFPWGLYRFEEIWKGQAQGHAVFWSHRMFGAPGEARAVLRLVMRANNWHRVQFVFPAHYRALRRFIENCGLHFEGLLRSGVGSGTMVTDGVLYSAVKEDFHAER